MTAETFDPSREPMRAIRDLIIGCESGDDDPAILECAQAAFTVLRALFGDTRPAEEIADVQAMIESIVGVQVSNGVRRTVLLNIPRTS